MNQATQLNFEYMCPKMDVDNVDNHLTKLNFQIYVCENGRSKRSKPLHQTQTGVPSENNVANVDSPVLHQL